MKLTGAQKAALARLAEREHIRHGDFFSCSTGLLLNGKVVSRLEASGLASIEAVGASAFANITEAGRAALRETE